MLYLCRLMGNTAVVFKLHRNTSKQCQIFGHADIDFEVFTNDQFHVHIILYLTSHSFVHVMKLYTMLCWP